MNLQEVLYCSLIALVVGSVLQPVIYRVMCAKAVLDVPSGRSSHTVATPRGGGVAVTLGAASALAVDRSAWVVAVPLLLYSLIGFMEDVRGVSVARRLSMQLAAGLAAAVGLLAANFGSGTRSVLVFAGAALGIAIWLVAYANVFNFMDGLNGISAGHAILGGSIYASIGWMERLPVMTVSGVAVAAASVTFLPWNAGRARIFLGDVGSYGLGALLGAIAMYGLIRGARVEAVLAPLALYLVDTSWTLAKRWWRGEAWYLPHRSHAYQRLTDFGWSHQRVTVVTVLIGFAVSACGMAVLHSDGMHRTAYDALALAMLAAYLACPAILADPNSLLSKRPMKKILDN